MPSSDRLPFSPFAALLIAAAMWGLIWYPLRLLEGAGLTGVWSTLIMYLSAALAGIVMCRHVRHQIARRPGLLILIALANGWTNVAFILAVIDGSVVRVLLLFYLSPVWTVILGWLILGERVTRDSYMVLLIAMSGALLMLWDPAVGMPMPKDRPDWLALSAGLAFAFSNVLVRKADDISVRLKTTFTWAGVTLTAVILILLQGEPLPVVPADAVVSAVVLGLAGILVMTLAVQYGVSHMPVRHSAVILLFEIVVGALSSQLLTDEVVTPQEWVGGILIMLASVLVANIYNKESRAPT
jgi:drug/metabolite transporter (DMT)-like permease